MYNLNIVCALYCEAKIIVEALKLKKDIQIHHFQIYRNHDSSINLILSGIGKLNSAIATSFIAADNHKALQAFLNLGIAGSQTISIGEAKTIHKLQDLATRKTFYPKGHLIRAIQSTNLITSDFPMEQLPAEGAVDMEAIGFYQAALKYSMQEHIQILKIISDNNNQDQKKITGTVVEKLVKQQIDHILNIIRQMQELLMQQTKKENSQFLKFIETKHFTEYEKIQLKRYLERADIFSIDIESILNPTCSGKEILKCLHEKLEKCY